MFVLVGMLIDLMVKSQLQESCAQEMVEVLQKISLENEQSSRMNIPLELLNKASLSEAAQRDLASVSKLLQLTKTVPRPKFHIELHT